MPQQDLLKRGASGGAEAPASVRIFGAFPRVASAEERLQSRILEIVTAGTPRGQVPGSTGDIPGIVRWWYARQRCGGSVRTDRFNAAVGELLARGELLEVWLKPYVAEEAPHLLMLPGYQRHLWEPACRAAGRDHLIERDFPHLFKVRSK